MKMKNIEFLTSKSFFNKGDIACVPEEQAIALEQKGIVKILKETKKSTKEVENV